MKRRPCFDCDRLFVHLTDGLFTRPSHIWKKFVAADDLFERTPLHRDDSQDCCYERKQKWKAASGY